MARQVNSVCQIFAKAESTLGYFDLAMSLLIRAKKGPILLQRLRV
jgi:hypothetical protein